MNYEIVESSRYRTGYGTAFRVREFHGQNDRRNRFTKGLFHTREQAQAWIDQRVAKLQRGRAAAADVRSADYSATNERLIREAATP